MKMWDTNKGRCFKLGKNMVPDQGENQPNTLASPELIYQISREITTTTHLPTLIERILILSIKNVGAKSGSIFILDQTGKVIASTLIRNCQQVQVSPQKIQLIMDVGLAGWVRRVREAALISDKSRDQRWYHRSDDASDAAEPKSVISVPFLARDQVVGVITLVHPQTSFFNEYHRDLIQEIADQSAISILNACFHTDTLRSAKLMTALAESAAAITSSLNLEEVLDRILEQISQLFETETVSLALVDETQHSLTFRASTIKGDQSPVGSTFPFGVGIAGWVAANQTGLIVPHPNQDDRFKPDVDQQIKDRISLIACGPLFIEGEVTGVVEILNPILGKFGTDDLKVLQGISSLAGTAIRQAQLFIKVQESHKKYYDLFQGNISAILLTDLTGKILEVNQKMASLSGFSKRELVGMGISRLHQSQNDAQIDSFQTLSKGKKASYEATLFTRDEARVPITVNVQQVSVHGNSFLQWELHDNTERKAVDQLREEMLSMIYHDLRSPLTNIISSLDVMSSLVDLKKMVPEIPNLFSIARRSARRIQRLTDSLLDINRLEAGYPVFNLVPANFETLLNESLQEIQPALSQKGVELDIQINQKLPQLMINDDMIQRVLINLLENSLRYTKTAGQIVIIAEVVDHELQVSVTDSGPGIPPSHLQYIFEKFTRLPSSGNRKGYGVGLAFCRLAVVAHGGRIWAENLPGGGACFKFTIPLENKMDQDQ